MVDYTIVEAKPWHCGQMARLLRREHQAVISSFGCNIHRGLRTAFDESTFRRACIVDGRVIALWGMAGPVASAYGAVWLAMANGIEKYPLALIKEVRRQLEEMRKGKQRLFCTVLDGDKAAERFAVFLGFVPHDLDYYDEPAQSRFGRREISRKLAESNVVSLPDGSRARVMTYL